MTGDTTPYALLIGLAFAAWAGLAVSIIVSRRRLRREDATQKGQGK